MKKKISMGIVLALSTTIIFSSGIHAVSHSDTESDDTPSGDQNRREQSQSVSTIVLAGHGIELYNLGRNRQVNFFSVYDKNGPGKDGKGVWSSYHLPKLKDGSEACPIVCVPYMHKDGTIYIGGAGGVLSRLTPNYDTKGRVGSYSHSYALFDKTLMDSGTPPNFVDNTKNAELMAIDNDLVEGIDINILRQVDGQLESRPLFHAYSNKLDDFHMLEEQGLLTKDEKNKLWTKEKYTIDGKRYSIGQATKELATLAKELATLANKDRSQPSDSDGDLEERFNKYVNGFRYKDGPAKVESIKIWERNNQHYKNNDYGALDAANDLMSDLSEEWENKLYIYKEEKQKWKMKIYDERLPVYRVNISEIPGNKEQLIVSVMGHIFRLNHKSQSLSFIGSTPQGCSRRVDNRGLIAFDENTFLVGDMGTGDSSRCTESLRFVVDKKNDAIENSDELTGPLLEELSKEWGGNTSPRVKSMTAGYYNCPPAEGDVCATVSLRTKHAGNDIVQADIRIKDGVLTVNNKKTYTAEYNNREYMSAVGKTLMFSLETEDFARIVHGLSPIKDRPEYRSYLSVETLTPTSTKDQGKGESVEKNEIPPLPEWVPYTGWGYDGIFAR